MLASSRIRHPPKMIRFIWLSSWQCVTPAPDRADCARGVTQVPRHKDAGPITPARSIPCGYWPRLIPHLTWICTSVLSASDHGLDTPDWAACLNGWQVKALSTRLSKPHNSALWRPVRYLTLVCACMFRTATRDTSLGSEGEERGNSPSNRDRKCRLLAYPVPFQHGGSTLPRRYYAAFAIGMEDRLCFYLWPAGRACWIPGSWEWVDEFDKSHHTSYGGSG